MWILFADRSAILNEILRGKNYVQVRPIGAKVMTFHLDVLDASGQPVRATFSTLYSAAAESATAAVSVAADCGAGDNNKRRSNWAPKVLLCRIKNSVY